MEDKHLKEYLVELDKKVDKAVGVDVKPIHYVMVGLLLLGLIQGFFM